MGRNEKINLCLGFCSFFIGLAIGFAFDNFVLTGRVVDTDNESLNNYSYTKAICNNEGCIDIVIYCEDGEVKEIEPVSDFVELEENLANLRENGRFCN